MDARKASTPTTEVICISPEPDKSLDEADEKLQKIGEQLNELEKQNSTTGELRSYIKFSFNLLRFQNAAT